MFLQSRPVLFLIIALPLWEAILYGDYSTVVMQVAVWGGEVPIIIVQNVLKVVMGLMRVSNACEPAEPVCKVVYLPCETC